MQYKVSNIKLDIKDENLLAAAAKGLDINAQQINSVEILSKSIDARRKSQIKYVYALKVDVAEKLKQLPDNVQPYVTVQPQQIVPQYKGMPIVVGFGPSGIFAALRFVEHGYKPIIIEQGKQIEQRVADVERFFSKGELDEQSNIQFGEGGAGTFSDGKLNTNVKSPHMQYILQTFIKFGAPKDIAYLAKAHIGSDNLRVVVTNIRKYLIKCGATFYFNCKVTDLIIKNGKVAGVICTQNNDKLTIDGDRIVLAVGHSARSTFEMLKSKGAAIEQKPFSIGLRIEHLQEKISFSQYGRDYKSLPPADYKLSCHLENGRSVYSFCMCPGGYVINAASENGGLVTNGISYYARDGKNANSAILVNVTPKDFPSSDSLAGVDFQRRYEQAAYRLNNSFVAPVQRLKDFCDGTVTKKVSSVAPTFSNGYAFADLNKCLPQFAADSLKQAVKIFDNKLKGFADSDSMLSGVETRSSSPVRILRDNSGQSNINGLYPCGEGAGYAGGIMSSCIDGIYQSDNVMINN